MSAPRQAQIDAKITERIRNLRTTSEGGVSVIEAAAQPDPPTDSWFTRQLATAERETRDWPDWARREAGLPVETAGLCVGGCGSGVPRACAEDGCLVKNWQGSAADPAIAENRTTPRCGG